jgi:hypothetical protein
MWREGKSYVRDRSKSTGANANHDHVPSLWRIGKTFTHTGSSSKSPDVGALVHDHEAARLRQERVLRYLARRFVGARPPLSSFRYAANADFLFAPQIFAESLARTSGIVLVRRQSLGEYQTRRSDV